MRMPALTVEYRIHDEVGEDRGRCRITWREPGDEQWTDGPGLALSDATCITELETQLRRERGLDKVELIQWIFMPEVS